MTKSLLLQPSPPVRDDVLNVGLLGCGTVGSAVAELLVRRSVPLSRQVGAPVRLTRIAVRDLCKPRGLLLDSALFTGSASDVAYDPEVDVLVEVMGGVETAGSCIVAALAAGKSVVTANKQLMARHGPALERLATNHGVQLLCEAAVGGAMPVVRMLRQSLAGDRVTRLVGILNGTTNYVLSQMGELGWSLDRAVEEARRAGFAEADPSEDLSGLDSAAKGVILSRIAFNRPVSLAEVQRQGLDGEVEALVDEARRRKSVVKLLVRAERFQEGVDVSVGPEVLDASHPLARVAGADNALVVDAEASGRIVTIAPGAGGPPTAAAVLSDLVCVLRARLSASAGWQVPEPVGLSPRWPAIAAAMA